MVSEEQESMPDVLAEGIFWILHSSKRMMSVQEIAQIVNANTRIVQQVLIKNNLKLYRQLDNYTPAKRARNWATNWMAIENRLPLSGFDYEDYLMGRRLSEEVFRRVLIDYFSTIDESVRVKTISKDLNIYKDEIEKFLDLQENEQVFRKFGNDNYQLKDFRIPLVRRTVSKQNSRNHGAHLTKPKIDRLGYSKTMISHRTDYTNINGGLDSFFVIPNRQEKLAKLEEKFEATMQFVAGESLSTFKIKSIESRICPNCDKWRLGTEMKWSIFCSRECIRDAEQKYLNQFTNEHRLIFSDMKSLNTITGMMFEADDASIPVFEAIEIVNNWFAFESDKNVSDPSIWALIDSFQRRKISFVERTKVDGLTVLDPDLVDFLIDLDKELYSRNEFEFPMQTKAVVKKLSEFNDNHDIQQFVRLMNDKRLLNSIRFIDRFTLCYFGAPSSVLEAVGDRIFIDSDRLKSWICLTFEGESEELLQFADEVCFASACMDFWPNMSIFVHPWIDFDPALASSRVIQAGYFSKLILSITSKKSKSKNQMDSWLRELILFFFELEAPKARTARGRYCETFRVSKERARQISQASKAHLEYLRGFELKRNNDGVAETKTRLIEFIRSHPGCTQAELANLIGSDENLSRWLYQNYGHLVLARLNSIEELALDVKRVDVLESLRAASTLSWPLTTKVYSDLLKAGFVNGVSSQRILQIYGTWKIACDEAGVECGETIRTDYTRDFSVAECIKFVGDYLTDENSNGTVNGYMLWREKHQTPDRVPSFGTLRNRIDRYWVNIVQTALRELRNQWFDADLEESVNGL